jgi:hypothetical protein
VPESARRFVRLFGHGHDHSSSCREQRADLWKRLSGGRDPETVEQIRALDARLTDLWAAIRAERARIRFGEREEIVKRARAEERLERAA